jgi:hypothetical protein
MVLVRVYHDGGLKPEIGLEVRRPGFITWERAQPTENDLFFFAATSEPNSGAEAFLVLLDPKPGLWEFRPYVVNFPRDFRPGDGARVQFEVTAENVVVFPDAGAEQGLLWPGDTGPSLRVRVQSAE